MVRRILTMANWTNQQLDAINGDDCSIIVSAAAGSGKTTVLVERLLRILSDKDNKVSADRIVVVTFSKFSASDMKLRLIKAITEKMELEPNNDWLIKQHSMLQNAKISTIHSFCFDLIRDNISDLNISNGFRIIEPTEEKILKLKAIQEVIEDMYISNHEEMEFLSQSLCDKTDDNLEIFIMKLYDFLVSVPFFEDWFQEKCIDYYSKVDIYNDDALKSVIDTLIENMEEAYNLSNMLLECCQDFESDKNLDIINKENIYFTDAINLLKSDNRFNVDNLKLFSQFKFSNLTLSKDNPNKDKAKRYRDTYKDLCTKKISFSILADVIEHYSEDKATNKRISQMLKDLIVAICDKLSSIKSEENVLGFSDAEQISIKLLAKKDENGNIIKTELAKNLSDYYQIIMIDEFQDSNNNQDLIFKMLSKGGTADRMGSNMFVVGDVKQSIYNFRLANPKNFLNVMEYSVPYDKNKKAKNTYIKLNKNFRSSIDVINFVNFIFENIMSVDAGEIEYNQDEMLINGAEYPIADRRTEIPIIDANEYSETDYVAKKIKSMLQNKIQVTQKDGSTRNCKPSDFCLLFMATTNIEQYFEKLQDLNIPVDFEQDEEFLKSREVSLLINMIRIVDNPMDNMSLTSIIMSPLFMFTPDDVAIIKMVNRDASMYSSVVKVSEDLQYKEFSKNLVDKCTYLISTINKLRNYSANCTTYELMSKIIDITDLISIMQVYDTSNKRRENIQILLKMAQTHDKNSITGISGFIRYINSIYDNNQDIDVTRSNSVLDCVTIKTIHGSKGLEFPFVFLCDVNRKFNEKDTLEVILKSFDYGLSYKLKDTKTFVEYSTVDTLRIANEKRSELRSEKMRLFYVALTRAKEKLFIPLTLTAINKKDIYKPTLDYKNFSRYIDTIEYNQKIPSRLVKSSIHMVDWLLMSLCCCNKAQPLRNFFGLNTNFLFKTDTELNMYIYNPNDFEISEQVENIEENVSILEQLKSNVLEKCNYVYGNINANLPARLSVSDIVKDDKAKLVLSSGYVSNVRFDSLKTPNFMTSEHITPAEKGTAIHIVMQYCDFAKLKINVTAEINRLKNEGYLTREQYSVMDFKLFDKFVKSDIFELALNNKTQRERSFLVKVSELNLKNDILDIYKSTDTMLQGCVDLLVFENDGITLVDYKSDNIEIENIKLLPQRYSLQLKLYKSAIELVESIPVKHMILYSTKLGKCIEVF